MKKLFFFSCFLEQNSYFCTQNEQNKRYEKDLWIDGGAAVRGDADGYFDQLSTSYFDQLSTSTAAY